MSAMEYLSNFDFTNSFITVLLVVVIICSYMFHKRNQLANTPPCYSGWIPWLGCAIEFGKSPLYFIDQCKKKLGPIFTLKVAGRRMTFITEPEDFKYFFNSNDVDFQQAVQEAVQNTASISRNAFYKHHTKIHDIVKWRLGQSQLEPFCKSLNANFNEVLNQWGKEGTGDLNKLVRSSMYKVIIDNLFGKEVLPTNNDMFKTLEKYFVKFDEDFEYGARLPPIFLKEWSASKWWLLDVFNTVMKSLDLSSRPTEQETLLQTLVKAIGDDCAPNFSLLMMWAALANAIPITFWTLAFILSDPECLEQARSEIRNVVAEKGSPSPVEFSQKDLTHLPFLKQCILEAIRLRSPGVIARGVKNPLQIKGYTVPAGDMLMLSPYWSHRNPNFFPDAEKFKPERWESADMDKNIFLEGFVAFGGGRYQCPGRWFALLEIHLFVAIILHKMELKLLEPVPKHSPLHLVGTQQPEGTAKVSFSVIN